MATPYRSPFGLPDEHMRLVGIIAAHWEAIDLLLQRGVAEIMSRELHEVRLLTENLSVPAKLDLLVAHARDALPTAKFKSFNKAIKAVQEAYGKRNGYVHAKWDSENDETDPWRITVRTRGGRISIIQKPTPIEELIEAAKELINAGDTLTATLQAYGLLKGS